MLLCSFHGAKEILVCGSLLVVKCDRNGSAIPIAITDYALIERMVLEYARTFPSLHVSILTNIISTLARVELAG